MTTAGRALAVGPGTDVALRPVRAVVAGVLAEYLSFLGLLVVVHVVDGAGVYGSLSPLRAAPLVGGVTAAAVGVVRDGSGDGPLAARDRSEPRGPGHAASGPAAAVEDDHQRHRPLDCGRVRRPPEVRPLAAVVDQPVARYPVEVRSLAPETADCSRHQSGEQGASSHARPWSIQ